MLTLMSKVIGYNDDTNTERSAQSQYEFKKRLQLKYKNHVSQKGELKCMITGLSLPSASVTAAHILPHRHARISQYLLSFQDINDDRNGILIFRPLEWAFDTGKISIVYDTFLSLDFRIGKDKTHRVKIIDSDIKDVFLREKYIDLIDLEIESISKTDSKYKGDRDEKLTKLNHLKDRFRKLTHLPKNLRTKQFGDFDGKPLQFGTSHERPFKRCFYFQWLMALCGARDSGNPVDMDLINEVGDFSSEDVDLAHVSNWIDNLNLHSYEEDIETNANINE